MALFGISNLVECVYLAPGESIGIPLFCQATPIRSQEIKIGSKNLLIPRADIRFDREEVQDSKAKKLIRGGLIKFDFADWDETWEVETATFSGYFGNSMPAILCQCNRAGEQFVETMSDGTIDLLRFTISGRKEFKAIGGTKTQVTGLEGIAAIVSHITKDELDVTPGVIRETDFRHFVIAVEPFIDDKVSYDSREWTIERIDEIRTGVYDIQAHTKIIK
jgi:hypothetical protein